jgi:hypothetical protein
VVQFGVVSENFISLYDAVGSVNALVVGRDSRRYATSWLDQ